MTKPLLHFGEWEKVLAGQTCDLLCTDPPFSKRTHEAQDETPTLSADGADRQPLSFKFWTEEDVNAFMDSWAPRTRGWMVVMTDHVLMPFWEAAMIRHDRYTFSPLSCVDPGSRVRMRGDGPSQWATLIMVCRPKNVEFAAWGTLRGGFIPPPGASDRVGRYVGGKPQWLLDQIVSDYSRRGDVVIDPCAGRGTTLRAAERLGRIGVGSEGTADGYAEAKRYLAMPNQLYIDV